MTTLITAAKETKQWDDVVGISKFAFVLLYNKSLSSLFSWGKVNFVCLKSLRFSGNKLHCSPPDHSLSVLTTHLPLTFCDFTDRYVAISSLIKGKNNPR